MPVASVRPPPVGPLFRRRSPVIEPSVARSPHRGLVCNWLRPTQSCYLLTDVFLLEEGPAPFQVSRWEDQRKQQHKNSRLVGQWHEKDLTLNDAHRLVAVKSYRPQASTNSHLPDKGKVGGSSLLRLIIPSIRN